VGLGEPSSFGQTDLSQSRIVLRERASPLPGSLRRALMAEPNVQVLATASANGARAARYRTAPNRLFCPIRDLTGRAPTRARNRRSAWRAGVRLRLPDRRIISPRMDKGSPNIMHAAGGRRRNPARVSERRL